MVQCHVLQRGRGQGTLDAMLQRGWSRQKEDGTPFLSLAHVIQVGMEV